MKTVKTLRWSWHILQKSLPYVCRCMYPDFVVETNKVADQPAYCTFLSAPLLWIKTLFQHFVGPDLGPTCLLILSAADKGTELKSQGQHDVQDQSHSFQATCCCCFKSWVARDDLSTPKRTWHINIITQLHAQIQKVLSEGVQLWQLFLVDDGRGSKHHYMRAIIGPPAKHHLNGISLVYRWWPNIECWLGS